MECQHKQDCCWVEVNMATLTYWGYYQILNIGVSLSLSQREQNQSFTSDSLPNLNLVVIRLTPTSHPHCQSASSYLNLTFKLLFCICLLYVVVVVDPTPPMCCQQSPAPESCGSQQSLPPGGKERLHFVGIRPEVQARKRGW